MIGFFDLLPYFPFLNIYFVRPVCVCVPIHLFAFRCTASPFEKLFIIELISSICTTNDSDFSGRFTTRPVICWYFIHVCLFLLLRFSFDSLRFKIQQSIWSDDLFVWRPNRLCVVFGSIRPRWIMNCWFEQKKKSPIEIISKIKHFRIVRQWHKSIHSFVRATFLIFVRSAFAKRVMISESKGHAFIYSKCVHIFVRHLHALSLPLSLALALVRHEAIDIVWAVHILVNVFWCLFVRFQLAFWMCALFWMSGYVVAGGGCGWGCGRDRALAIKSIQTYSFFSANQFHTEMNMQANARARLFCFIYTISTPQFYLFISFNNAL